MRPVNLGAVRLPLLAAAVLAILSAPLAAQIVEKERTFADLTASHPCNSGSSGRNAIVTDCDAADDIGDGGGAFRCFAHCDGTAPWETVSIGGGAGLSDGDKGDITVASSGAAWTIDADSVALGTDTTGNYAGSASEGGEANTLAPAVVIEGATADAFEGNFAFTDPTADWTWTWGATGAVSGVASITGGASGSSTLTLDGDSSVSGSVTINGSANISANRIATAVGDAGGVVVGDSLMYETAGHLVVFVDPTNTYYRAIYALGLSTSGDITAGGVMTVQELRLTSGAVGSCGSGEKGNARVAADGTFCTCNGTVWTATPGSGSCI